MVLQPQTLASYIITILEIPIEPQLAADLFSTAKILARTVLFPHLA
jgi:hypothetical protein